MQVCVLASEVFMTPVIQLRSCCWSLSQYPVLFFIYTFICTDTHLSFIDDCMSFCSLILRILHRTQMHSKHLSDGY